MRISYAGSGQANWWIEECPRGIRFSRNFTEREHSIIQSVILVQGEPIGGGGGEVLTRYAC